ncbi:hypothetical protein Q4S45_08400 [Massilia sp. R2A-15]|uniref:hypothetical protein n=1 Tax=Massilia sp. R2A-15 TaxID=3064278 RepID=UPI002733B84E|nr:hypothetical protein [Massilia sp. R2A-15]WLI91126.1 hypothetical protein Q4S45_08400 [Massilia sp. R2A-15]
MERSPAAFAAPLWFCSHLRLTTPLRALRLHGAVNAPGVRSHDMEEGRITGYWRVAGDGTQLVPSLIGMVPWQGGELLACLIAIREIVESDISIDERIGMLSREMTAPRWPGLRDHPALALPEMVELFFPSFLHSVPGLSAHTVRAMMMLGMDTPAKILAQDPAALLGLKRVGSATLATLLNTCRRAAAFRPDSRTDAVER